MRTLIGGMTPNTDPFGADGANVPSFSALDFTTGSPLVGRGESFRSATGDGDRGLVRSGGGWPPVRVLLFRRETGDVLGTTEPAPLFEEFPEVGDLGDVVPGFRFVGAAGCGIGFSVGTAGLAVGRGILGRPEEDVERRCCGCKFGGTPELGEGTFWGMIWVGGNCI
jgi:hypothetical protein